ncbi:MAG: glycosyltransferase, partial [Desulfuromonadales bacterium]|nr:glycosyltransferase [Desulfuromonadales bacterium]
MKASVLINNYNYGQFLNACIDSVLHQVESDVEVIVYDDGSTDDSAERICAYGDEIKGILAESFGKYPSY